MKRNVQSMNVWLPVLQDPPLLQKTTFQRECGNHFMFDPKKLGSFKIISQPKHWPSKSSSFIQPITKSPACGGDVMFTGGVSVLNKCLAKPSKKICILPDLSVRQHKNSEKVCATELGYNHHLTNGSKRGRTRPG